MIPGVLESPHYTVYAGCAVMAGIPMKFGTAQARSKPEVGSVKSIDVYGGGGVSRPSLSCDTSDQISMPPTIFLRP